MTVFFALVPSTYSLAKSLSSSPTTLRGFTAVCRHFRGFYYGVNKRGRIRQGPRQGDGTVKVIVWSGGKTVSIRTKSEMPVSAHPVRWHPFWAVSQGIVIDKAFLYPQMTDQMWAAAIKTASNMGPKPPAVQPLGLQYMSAVTHGRGPAGSTLYTIDVAGKRLIYSQQIPIIFWRGAGSKKADWLERTIEDDDVYSAVGTCQITPSAR